MQSKKYRNNVLTKLARERSGWRSSEVCADTQLVLLCHFEDEALIHYICVTFTVLGTECYEIRERY